MGSCMKKFEFIHQVLTKFKCSFWKILNVLSSFDVLLIVKGISDFNHDFSLTLLDDKIWKNNLANMKHPIASCTPSINLFSRVYRHLFRCVSSYTSSKYIMEPIHKRFISSRNCNKCLKVFVTILPISTEISDVESTFSIHNSSHICGLSIRIFF